MQNCYVADAGDFSKYLLLKYLCKNDLTLGVNWCLVDDESNNDGKHTSYLEKFKDTDKEVVEKLKKIIDSNTRKIDEIQNSGILPINTLYYGKKIPEGTLRFNWFNEGLKTLEKSEIVFFDPDNGLEINSCGKLHTKAKKYIYFDEIYKTYEQGKSIIIYQHSNRSDNVLNQAQSRIQQIKDCLNNLHYDCSIDVLFAGQGTSRFYLIVKNPLHSEVINKNLFLFNTGFLSDIFKNLL